MTLHNAFAALGTGLVVGIVFAAVDLPIPAPPKLAGVMGIVGIYLGFKVVSHSDALLGALP